MIAALFMVCNFTHATPIDNPVHKSDKAPYRTRKNRLNERPNGVIALRSPVVLERL